MSKLRDALDQLKAKYGDDPRLHQKSLGEQLGGIPGDVLSSALELVGIEKSPDQLLRERKYPVTSFVGGLVGFGGPYGAAYKTLRGVKNFERAVEGIKLFGDVAKSPIKTRALQEAARLATLETGRVAVGMAIPGGESFEEMAGDSALNIAFGGAASAGLGLIAGAGRRAAPLQEIFKDINLDAPTQIQMRQLSEALALGKIDPKYEVEARNRLAKLGDAVRTQWAPADQPYVGETPGGGGKRINRIFNTRGREAVGLERRRLARTSEAGFRSDADWQAIPPAAGLPEDWVQYSQYPRHVSFRTDSSARQIQNTVYQTMDAAGDGWYMTRENNDGLFVLAKRLRGKAIEPKVGDEWLFLKTDQPGKFRPNHAAWSNAVADHVHFLAKDMRTKGPVTEIYDSARKMLDTLPLRTLVNSKIFGGPVAEMGGKLGKVLGIDEAVGNSGEATKRVKDFFVEHFAPTVQQFGRSPRAGRVFAIAKSTYDAAQSTMRKLVYGERALDPNKSAFVHLLGNPVPPSGPSIKGTLDKLADNEVEQVWNMWKVQANRDTVEKAFADGKISDNVREVLHALEDVDAQVTDQIIKVEGVTGGGKFKPREGHYGLSRRWEGDNRVAVRDQTGKLVAVASGQSRVGAQREAKNLIGRLEKEGMTGLREAEEFDVTQTSQLARDLQTHVTSPAWVLERQNVRGYKFDDKPFTKAELLEAYDHSIQSRTKYMASRTVDDLLADEIAKVAVEDPTMHRILVGRLNDLAGQRTPLAKYMDQAVDTVLGPALGGHSASKIVSATNKAMWHLELGALRAAYPVMNMLTFLQTVIPEISFVGSAAPDVLGKYYNNFVMNTGQRVRPFGVLDPLKMWWQGTRRMHSKDPGFLKQVERGINEGILDPRFIEESTGATQAKFQTSLKDGGLGKWIEAVSEYMPAQSEKWSRLNSWATADAIATDLLGITDDELRFQFNRDFTDRTMFRYGMDARPRVFTTPAGSMFGLFKNWMMHYMGMMLDYTQEGAVKGNWAPLLWQSAGTFAAGGASAMPLWAVANGLSNAVTGKSALVNGYDWFEPAGEGVSDAIFFGLPALAGISLSSNAAAPFSNPMRDVTQMASMVHMDRANAAAKAFGAAIEHWQATGQGPFEDANTRDMFFRAFAPKTAYRLMATLEDGVINSLATSNPIAKNVGPMEKIWFTLGFNPIQIEKAYAVSDELWQDQNAHRAAVQRYGEAMAHAFEKQDGALMETIAQRAIVDGVDLSSVERSAMSRMAKGEADIVSRQFKPEDIEERMVVLGKKYEENRDAKPR